MTFIIQLIIKKYCMISDRLYQNIPAIKLKFPLHCEVLKYQLQTKTHEHIPLILEMNSHLFSSTSHNSDPTKSNNDSTLKGKMDLWKQRFHSLSFVRSLYARQICSLLTDSHNICNNYIQWALKCSCVSVIIQC